MGYQRNSDSVEDGVVDKLNAFMMCIAGFGSVANCVCAISVQYQIVKHAIPKSYGRLLVLQSLYDTLACTSSILMYFSNPNLTLPDLSDPTMNQIAAYFLCYFWYNQIPFWLGEFWSVYNILLLSVDRCIAIRAPLKHKAFASRIPFIVAFVAISVTLYVCVMFGCTTVSLVYEDETTSMPAMTSSTESTLWTFPANYGHYECYLYEQNKAMFFAFFRWYLVTWFWVVYFFPAVGMAICYVLMISALTVKRHENLTRSANVLAKRSAARQLVKIVIVLGVSFVLCLCQDSVTTSLGGLMVYEYVPNTPMQKIGIATIAIYFSVNPIATFAFMKVCRKPIVNVIRKMLRPLSCIRNASTD